MDATQYNGYRIFKFKRPLILCNSEDRPVEVIFYAVLFSINIACLFYQLKSGSPYVIFAYGLKNPEAGKDISYHESQRGGKTVNLISNVVFSDSSFQDTETFEMKISNVKYFFKFTKKLIILLLPK